MKSMRMIIAATVLAFAPASLSANEYGTDCSWVRGLYHNGSGPKVYVQNHRRGRHMACGASWGQGSLRVAKRNAMQICAQYGQGCRVVSVSH